MTQNVCSHFTVSTFKRPGLDDITEEDLEIDIVQSWTDLEKEFIAEGLISGGSNVSCTIITFFIFKNVLLNYLKKNHILN